MKRPVLGAGLVAALCVLSASSALASGSYAAQALSEHPVAFWQLNETGDPSGGGLQAYDYTGNGYNGTWGTDCLNYYDNVLSPQPPEYAGFDLFQGALQTTAGNTNSVITLPYLNLNTNTVTICMWINPDAGQANWTGLLGNRTPAGDAAVVGFSGNSVNGMAALGYTWNTNSSSTYNWNSQLYAQVGIWQFVAWVMNTNGATIYQYYVDTNANTQLKSAFNAVPSDPEAFNSGGVYLGSDANGTAQTPGAVFNGEISDAAVFNSALTADQILALFAAGAGVSGYAPQITGQPQNTYVFAGNPATLKATGINGTSPFAYQWTLNGTNVQLIDTTNFTGANSSALTIGSVTAKDAGSYQLTITNLYGSVVSSNALLAIQTPSLVGEWLNGTAAATNLVDVSGYSLATNHGAYIVGAGNLVFTNDVPPGKTGYSAFFYNGDTGLAISNSSTLDANYDSTFDNQINNAFTVSCWGRGFPAGWYPFVSKWGEGRPHNSPDGGWQLRADGNGINPCFTVRDEQIGTFGYGCNTNDATDDMATTLVAGNDGCWHFYSGTFNAVTGIRCLYVDGVLAAQETNNVQYDLASWAHLCIGGKDLPPGNSFGFFSTFEIYDVRIYNYALTNGVLPPSPPPPHLSVQPQSVLVFTNTTAQFRATASGTAPLVYQWTLNGTNVNLLPDSANFTGANSNVLTILNVATNDAGSYQLIVTNLYGSAISSNAFLTIEQPALVGEWFAGNTNLADVSGYQPAGTHDGYVIAGSYSFSSDVPPLRPGKSLNIAANSGIAISNSSTLDAAYTNTFDDTIHDAMSVTFWAKGFPGSWSWNPCVSKYGEGPGWQFREGGGPGQIPCWTVRDNGTGVFVQGAGPGWAMGGDLDDLHAATGVGGGASYYNVDNNWHFYAGTFDANTTLRNLYIDGVLWGQETNNMQYNMAPAEHLVIGAKDSPPGNNYGSYGGPFNIYDVRIYNYALTQQQVQPPHPPPGPTPPQITQQPPGSINTTCVGVTVQIGAIAGGGGPLTNQWQFNGTNLVDGNYGGVVISGSQSIAPASGFETTLLTIANVTTNYSGVYTLIVSDANGSVVSSNANLTVGTDSVAPVPAGALVGEWLNGTNSLADTSGYSPAGTHDAKVQSGAVWWTNDVPPIAPPGSQSLYFNNAGLTVSNSSTLDANYTNTFDLAISNSMTIECWAKGWPGSWNPFVSKYGENGIGWQLRCDGWNTACWTVRAPTGGGDMGAPATSNDSFWHHYAGTYDVTSGLMKLYIDGVLAVTWTGVGPYNLSPPSHLMIGARDGGGNAFGNYYSGEIYGVQIYDTALSADQVNASLVSPVTVPPTFSGPIAITSGPSGSQLVLTWPYGTLLQATNVAGPWTPVAGAVSPYTNLINMTAPNMFYKLSNP